METRTKTMPCEYCGATGEEPGAPVEVDRVAVCSVCHGRREVEVKVNLRPLAVESDDKYGESGTYYYLLNRFGPEGEDLFPVTDDEKADKERVAEFLELNGIVGQRCGHEHDCCGCVFTWNPDVVAYDDIRENWIIAQHWGRNV